MTSSLSSLGALAALLDEGNCMCDHNATHLIRASSVSHIQIEAEDTFRSWDRSAQEKL